MKINRTKNAIVSSAFSILLRIYRIGISFLMRTVFVYTIGIEFLGLNSLFTSVLQMLNLAELGVGSAMVFSMYKPIAEDDEITICALMKLYKTYYRIIGTIILAIGLILTPFLPELVNKDVPSGISIYVLYLMHLSCTVLTYWLFAYKNSLFAAHQRNDVVSKVTICTDTFKYIIQLYALIVLKNYYVYILAVLFMQIVENITVAICADKKYPRYKAKGQLGKSEISQINQRIRDLFTAKLGGVVMSSVDSLIISGFLGLTVLAIYQNYFYIISSVIGILTNIYLSCMAGMGNSLITEKVEKNYKDLRTMTLLVGSISTIAVTGMLCLMQPFMVIWMGKDRLLEMGCVVCLCCYFFIYEINQLLNAYKDAAGIWRKDRFRPLVKAIVNLILSIILVNYMGVYGVLLATVLTIVVIGLPWLLNNLFTEIFKIGLKEYIILLIKVILGALLSCIISWNLCDFVQGAGIFALVLKGIICILVSSVILIVMWHKSEEYLRLVNIVKRMLKIGNK